MPGQFLTTAERERWDRFPPEIVEADLVAFFTLSLADRGHLPVKIAAHNRLGFALQLCAIRYLGFCPADLATVPLPAVTYLARQVDADPKELSRYGARAHTRTDHLQKVLDYLGFRKAKPRHLKALQRWLAERALEHDRPSFLLQMACEKLYHDKLVRPGITILERMVTRGRVQAQQDTFRLLAPVLTDGCKVLLDRLLVRDDALGCTPLAWLRHSATSNSATAILATLEKLAYLRRWGLEDWDLRALPPNRLKFLAQLGRKSTSQALQRTPEERRYPILVAFLQQSLLEITDEAIDLFDRCLAEAYALRRS